MKQTSRILTTVTFFGIIISKEVRRE